MQTTMRKKLALRKIKRELEDPEINRGRGGRQNIKQTL